MLLLLSALAIALAPLAAHAQARPAYFDQPASLRMVGKAGAAQKVPLVIVLPCTGGSAEEIYEELRGELPLTDYAVLLPQGAPSSRDYRPAFGNFVGWFEARLLPDLQQALASQPIDRARVFLVGFSLGGDLACALVARHPELFQGIFVMGSRCSSAPSKSSLAELQKRGARAAFTFGTSDDSGRKSGLKKAHDRLAAQKIATQLSSFDGSHQLPPGPIARGAFTFLFQDTAAAAVPSAVPAR